MMMQLQIYTWGISNNGVQKYREALGHLKNARKVFSNVGDTLTVAETYYYAGESYMGLGEYDTAKVKLDSAMYFADYMNIKPVQIAVLENLSRYAQETENYKAAFTYEKIKDSLNTAFQEDLNKKNTQALEIGFQTKKKEQQITLLTSKNELAEQQRKNQLILIFAGLILFSIAGLFFFFYNKNRQKTHKKLKEIDTAKSTFFANISHEFRTPLSLIQGPLEDQLEQDTLKKSERKNLLMAQRNVFRLQNLVEELLSLAKLESGTMKLQVQPGELSKFIELQAEAFQYSAKEKNCQYLIQLDATPKQVWFDAEIIEKICFNLFGNALKYTPEGGEISIKGHYDSGNFILSVKNTGSYISENESNQLFKRFYQTDPKNRGTGIGLSLTKELVELHKGTINILSDKEPNTTTFTIKIACSEERFSEKEKLAKLLHNENFEPIKNEALPTDTVSTLKEDTPILLIVDDAKEVREYVSTIFEGSYHVLTGF